MVRALALGCMVALSLATLASCATTSSAQQEPRKLRALERSFHSFVSVKLVDLDDVEAATASLEQLRLVYVDVLSEEKAQERDRLLALLRLAELHLDLSARVRRVPYPPGADRAAFDARLSSLALPLEATGKGMLQQLLQRAERASVDGRFVHRARLYLHLHPQQGAVELDDDDVEVLQQELMAVSFRAPRTLLEAGRVHQRAARR